MSKSILALNELATIEEFTSPAGAAVEANDLARRLGAIVDPDDALRLYGGKVDSIPFIEMAKVNINDI